MTKPKPPSHLSSEMKRFWKSVNDAYELEQDALLILRAAAENWDRAQEAREQVKKDGLVLNGRRHPAIDIEKQAYGLFLRSLRQLGIDAVAAGPIGRPPGT